MFQHGLRQTQPLQISRRSVAIAGRRGAFAGGIIDRLRGLCLAEQALADTVADRIAHSGGGIHAHRRRFFLLAILGA